MNQKELLNIWEKFTEKNDFMLNPEKWHIGAAADGVLKNEADYGLKLCPCRVSDGSRKINLELLCPCNFKIQETWKTKSQCWCGLFVKR